MIIALIIILAVIVSIWLFMKQPQFGKLATGDRLAQIKNSSHYQKDQFQNIHFTPQLTENVNMLTVMRKFFFRKEQTK